MAKFTRVWQRAYLAMRLISRKPTTTALLALILIASACNISDERMPTAEVSPSVPTATSRRAMFPDLQVVTIQPEVIDQEPCIDLSVAPYFRIIVRNAGETVAIPLAIDINSVRHTVPDGLAPGKQLSLVVQQPYGELEVITDPENEIVESDETNNSLIFNLPHPTLAPNCQPTPDHEARIHQATYTLTGHEAKVWSLAFSPDGKLLASGSVDNTLRLWRVQEGALLRTMQGHPFPILAVDFSPDGLWLATGSDDSLIRVWRVSNGSLNLTLPGHAGWINTLAYSPDGRWLASGSDDFTVRLWNASDGHLAYLIDEGMSRVLGLAFSPDSSRLGWAESNGTVRVWITTSRKWEHIYYASDSPARCIAFSPGGDYLAAGFADGGLRLWDLNNGELQREWAGHQSSVNGQAFSPDGKYLATGSTDQTVRLWALDKLLASDNPFPQPEVVFTGHTGAVTAVAFSPLGGTLASASEDQSIRLWQAPE